MAKSSSVYSLIFPKTGVSSTGRVWNRVGEWRYIVAAGAMALSVGCSGGSQTVSLRNGGAGSDDSTRAEGVEIKFSAGESNNQGNGLNLGSQRKALALIELSYSYFNPPSATTGVQGKVAIGYDLTPTSFVRLTNSVKVPLGSKVVFSDVAIREFRIDPLENEVFITRNPAASADVNGAISLAGVTNGKRYTYAVTLVKPAEIPAVSTASTTVNVPFTFTTEVKDCLNDSALSASPDCGVTEDSTIETGTRLVVESGQSREDGVNAPLIEFDKTNTRLATGATFVSAPNSPISNKSLTVTKVTLKFNCIGDSCPTHLGTVSNAPHMVINGVTQPSPKILRPVSGSVMRLYNAAKELVTTLPTGTAMYSVELDVGDVAVAQSADGHWKNDISFTLERREGNKTGTGKFELRNFVVKNY